MEVIAGPEVVQRPAQATLGIRVVTPFRGMLAVRDQLWKELDAWREAHGLALKGSRYMRLNVIDMVGLMDIEAGAVALGPAEGDDRVKRGEFPAGRYATLTYREHDRRANKMLIDWCREHGVTFDRDDDPAGDRFACRYEMVLSDALKERRKKLWTMQLNFLTRN